MAFCSSNERLVEEAGFVVTSSVFSSLLRISSFNFDPLSPPNNFSAAIRSWNFSSINKRYRLFDFSEVQ
jgi:hypothetical protein